MWMYEQLLGGEGSGDGIKVGIIGGGEMGFGVIWEISKIGGMIVGGVCDIDVGGGEKGGNFYKEDGKRDEMVVRND